MGGGGGGWGGGRLRGNYFWSICDFGSSSEE